MAARHPLRRSKGELVRALPFKLGRITRIGGSANYPSAGLGVNYSAGRPLTGAEEGVVGSGGEDHGQRERLVASAARSLEQGAPHWPEAPAQAERCLDHTGPAPVRGAKRHLALFNLAIDSKLRAVISSGCRPMTCVSAAGCETERR